MKTDALRIEVERLLKEPIELDFNLAPGDMDLQEDHEFAFESRVTGHLKARLAGPGNVLVDGTMKTTAHADCVRCLRRLGVALDVPFRAVFMPLPPQHERARFKELDDDAKLYYEGDLVHPVEQMREELMLALPTLPTCASVEGRDCPDSPQIRALLKKGNQRAEEIAGPEDPAPNSWAAQIARVRKELDTK